MVHCLEIMKALSDESRLNIVNSLIEKPQYVEEISQRIGLAASTVSFHLKKLEQAGLASKRKEQYYFIYSVNPDIFDVPLRELISPVQGDLREQESRLNSYRKKVMDTFISSGKLLRIPAQHKKRLIILEHLAKRFEAGRQYGENEVNKIIQGFHEDYCTLRRLMIDNGIFLRKGDRYYLHVNEQNPASDSRSTGGKNEIGSIKMTDRKQLIKEYKSTVRPMGVFQLKNNVTGRIYLSSSKNLNASENRHMFQLQQKGHSNAELQAEYNSLGPGAFSFEIVDRLEPKEDPEYDYTDDLKTLFDLWLEKLTGAGRDVKLLVKHCRM